MVKLLLLSEHESVRTPLVAHDVRASVAITIDALIRSAIVSNRCAARNATCLTRVLVWLVHRVRLLRLPSRALERGAFRRVAELEVRLFHDVSYPLVSRCDALTCMSASGYPLVGTRAECIVSSARAVTRPCARDSHPRALATRPRKPPVPWGRLRFYVASGMRFEKVGAAYLRVGAASACHQSRVID